MFDSLVCIIILNWNGYKLTRDCLRSIQKITYQNYKIILVDNGSIDNSVEKLEKEFKQLDYLVLEKNYGFTGGNNKGIEYATNKYNPDYFLLLNNDTEVEPDFLSKLIVPFLHDNTIYATVPKIYFFKNKDIIWYAGGRVRKLTGIVKEYGKNKRDSNSTSVQKKVGFMSGCAALISKQAINEIGLLDDMFFAYSEDADYSLRIIKSGNFIMYVPDSCIYHKVSQTFISNNSNWFKYYLATRNKVLLQHKHLPQYIFPIFVLWFSFRWVFYLTLKLIITGQYNSVVSISKGFYDGLTNNTKRYEL